MTTNFRCPRCKKEIKVGKLRASYTCPHCKYSMVLTREDKIRGWTSYKNSYKFSYAEYRASKQLDVKN